MPIDEMVFQKNKAKRLKRLEALTTAGCGYGNAKKRILEAFWDGMWPILVEEGGWTKMDGAGPEGAATYFIPEGVDVETARKGKDYYDKVKNVIKRVMEKRNHAENHAAKAYTDMLCSLKEAELNPQRNIRLDGSLNSNNTKNYNNNGNNNNNSSSQKQDTPKRHVLSSRTKLDKALMIRSNSYSDDEYSYIRLKIRVGDEYQASSIPKAGSYLAEKPIDDKEDEWKNSHSYEIIWDPVKAHYNKAENLIHQTVEPNKRELAMVELHKRQYITTGFDYYVRQIVPSDTSDWTQCEKNQFYDCIFQEKKNFHTISKIMGKSISNCYIYYLSNIKNCDEYPILKALCAQDKLDRLNSSEACQLCGRDEDLYMCESCGSQFHLRCMYPAREKVPKGNWDCQMCLHDKLDESKRWLEKQTRITFETRKRKNEGCLGDEATSDENTIVNSDDNVSKQSVECAADRVFQDNIAAIERAALSISQIWNITES